MEIALEGVKEQKFRLSLVRSKVSVHCNFLLQRFDYEVKKYYKDPLSLISFLDRDFIEHIMVILETKSIEIDGVPKPTIRNNVEKLCADLRNMVGENDDDF